MRKTKLFLMTLLLTAGSICGYAVTIGDINYSLSGNTATVTGLANSSVTELIIPAEVENNGTTYSVTRIGDRAFYECTELTSATIPESVTSIGYIAFYGCTNLTSVTISNSVTSIEYAAFSNCTGITRVNISDLTAWCEEGIGSAFSSSDYSLYLNDEKITDLIIPSSVTKIEKQAFYNCIGLTSVTIPSSVTSIGYFAFSGCTGLTSISVAEGNPTYDSRNNCNCIIRTSSNTLIEGCKNSVIPNSVTDIVDYAFYNCTGLTSVTIPNSVTSIGEQAFYGCTGLTAVAIGHSVTSIGYEAFNGCSSLASIIIPNSVTSIGRHAFYGCSGLTSVTIPNSVTSIEDGAFYECTGLISVTIPNSVTSIGGHAFYGCSGLTSITIPNSVTSIGYYAFRDCSGLTQVTIGNSVESIREQTFSDCTSLTSVTLGNSVTSIGSHAFSGCTSLTSVTIPNSVTSIEYAAFSGCSGLTSVSLGNSVTTIGSDAFSGCTSLTSVTIPNSVTSIEYAAFSGCSGLTSVSLGNSVTTIGSDAFEHCSGLTTVTIPESVTSIGSGAFEYCTGLTSVTIPNSVTSIQYDAFYRCTGLTDVYIDIIDFANTNRCYSIAPNRHYMYQGEEIIGDFTIPESVTRIGDYAFYGCTGLTSVTIPNSVTSIGDYAFYGCTGLATITIPNSVTSMGNYAFYGCTGLTSVTIPNSVTSIGDYAFYGCTGLATITIPNSVTSMGNYAFSGCTGLTSVTLPESVTSIGKYAFFGCTGLTRVNIFDLTAWCEKGFGAGFSSKYSLYLNDEKITDLIIPNSVTNIVDYAFYNCTGLTSVTIPNSVTSIESSAFSGCTGLTSIDIPNSVTNIGNYAFYCCTGLTSVTIPNSVTNIGNYAFHSCSGLTSVTIPNSVTNIGNYAFYNCAGLTSVTIPKTVTSIGNNAFYRCTGLTSVTIPNSVTSIGWSAFYGCTGLTSLTILGSVTSIGSDAFSWCTGLKLVIIQKETPFALNTSTFSSSTYSDAVLVVPDGTIDAYKATTWSNFTNIVEMGTQTETCTRLSALADEADTLLLQVSSTASEELVAAANTLRILTDEARAKVTAFVAKESDIEALQTAIDAVDEIMHTHTVTYFVDGEVYATEQYREGASIAPLDEPTKEFCAFSGWSEIPEVMGTEDITVNGTFKMVYAEGYNLEFLPFALSTTGGADATCEIVFNVGSDVVQGSKVEFDLMLPQAWVDNYMIDNVQKNADLGTRFYNLTDPVDNGDGTWHFTLEAKSANYYFGKVASTKVGSFQVYQDGGGNDGNYAIAEGVYDIELTNITVTGSDGKTYKPAPYTGNLYVGSPKASVEDGTVAFAGDYSDPATLQLLTDALPTDDETITTVDLTEVTALPDNTEISVANDNALVYVREGISLANAKNVVAGDVCENFVISDGKAFGALKAFTAENATYERNTTSRFGTICLPYAVSSDASVKYYTLDRVEGNTLYLAEETEIAAGVPAVFENVGGGSTVDASGTNVAVQGTAVLPSGGDLKLIGTYETLVITDPAELANSYYISKDQFHQATSSLTINPFRAYFTYTGGSASKVFDIATEDDVTAIANLDSENAEPEGIYDVSGAKLPALQKGVNIVRYANGKTQKIIVK